MVSVVASLLIAAAASTLFSLWYDRVPRRKLSPREIEAYMEKVRTGRADDSERLRRFEAFGRSDDGREFYMVNLLRYRREAGEPPARGRTGVPRSHRAYMRAWSKVALRRASHLVYRGKPAMKLFGRPDEESWDAVAIMRYRSRRDLFEIVTDPVFSKDASLKNVAVEYTDVYPSSVGFVIASPRLLLFMVVFPLSLIVAQLVS